MLFLCKRTKRKYPYKRYFQKYFVDTFSLIFTTQIFFYGDKRP